MCSNSSPTVSKPSAAIPAEALLPFTSSAIRSCEGRGQRTGAASICARVSVRSPAKASGAPQSLLGCEQPPIGWLTTVAKLELDMTVHDALQLRQLQGRLGTGEHTHQLSVPRQLREHHE